MPLLAQRVPGASAVRRGATLPPRGARRRRPRAGHRRLSARGRDRPRSSPHGLAGYSRRWLALFAALVVFAGKRSPPDGRGGCWMGSHPAGWRWPLAGSVPGWESGTASDSLRSLLSQSRARRCSSERPTVSPSRRDEPRISVSARRQPRCDRRSPTNEASTPGKKPHSRPNERRKPASVAAARDWKRRPAGSFGTRRAGKRRKRGSERTARESIRTSAGSFGTRRAGKRRKLRNEGTTRARKRTTWSSVATRCAGKRRNPAPFHSKERRKRRPPTGRVREHQATPPAVWRSPVPKANAQRGRRPEQESPVRPGRSAGDSLR